MHMARLWDTSMDKIRGQGGFSLEALSLKLLGEWFGYVPCLRYSLFSTFFNVYLVYNVFPVYVLNFFWDILCQTIHHSVVHSFVLLSNLMCARLETLTVIAWEFSWKIIPGIK